MNEKVTLGSKIYDMERRLERRLSIIICWMVFGVFLTNATFVLFGGTNNDALVGYVSIASKIVLLSLIIYSFPMIIKKINCYEFIIGLGLLLFLVINLLMAGNDSGCFNLVSTFLLTVCPMIVVILAVSDYQLLCDHLTEVSKLIIIIACVVLIITKGFDVGEYSMGFSNSMIIPVICMLYKFFVYDDNNMLFFAFAGVLVILVLGSRGALLAIGVYFIIMLLKQFEQGTVKLKMLLIGTVILFCLLFFNQLLFLTAQVLDHFGINSRTLYLIMNDMGHLSGREAIYDGIINEVTIHPFDIRWIGGEYAFTGNAYAHNFVLELIGQFGVIFGGVGVLVILVLSCKTAFFLNNDALSNLMIILFATSVPILCVSDSIWISVYFWMWIMLNIKERI